MEQIEKHERKFENCAFYNTLTKYYVRSLLTLFVVACVYMLYVWMNPQPYQMPVITNDTNSPAGMLSGNIAHFKPNPFFNTSLMPALTYMNYDYFAQARTLFEKWSPKDSISESRKLFMLFANSVVLKDMDKASEYLEALRRNEELEFDANSKKREILFGDDFKYMVGNILKWHSETLATVKSGTYSAPQTLDELKGIVFCGYGWLPGRWIANDEAVCALILLKGEEFIQDNYKLLRKGHEEFDLTSIRRLKWLNAQTKNLGKWEIRTGNIGAWWEWENIEEWNEEKEICYRIGITELDLGAAVVREGMHTTIEALLDRYKGKNRIMANPINQNCLPKEGLDDFVYLKTMLRRITIASELHDMKLEPVEALKAARVRFCRTFPDFALVGEGKSDALELVRYVKLILAIDRLIEVYK